MISSPFPPSIAFAAAFPDQLDAFELFPAEAEALTPKTIAKRVMHFRLGRAAARAALAQLGSEAQPIRRAKDGRPLWPEGIVGAITHTDDVAAAAVARAVDCLGVGLDLEALSRQVSPEVARRVCSADELRWVEERDSNQRSLMVFAAKEAIFKALYPLERIFLGFADAELAWDERAGRFLATLNKQAAAGFPAGVRFPVGCDVVNVPLASRASDTAVGGSVVKRLVMAYTHLPEELR